MGWRAPERVDEGDHVDVRGEGVRHRPHPVERGPACERRVAVENVVDLLGVVARDHPVAHRHLGPDVPDAQGLLRSGGLVERAEHGAPTAVDPADAGRRTGPVEGRPRVEEVLRPSEPEIGHHRRSRYRPNDRYFTALGRPGVTPLGNDPNRPRGCERRLPRHTSRPARYLPGPPTLLTTTRHMP